MGWKMLWGVEGLTLMTGWFRLLENILTRLFE